MAWKSCEKLNGWLPSRQSGPRGANHGTQDTSRAPKIHPKHPNCTPRLPKWSSCTLGIPNMEAWKAPEIQKCIHSASKFSWNLKLAQVFINIATAIIKWCDPLLPMFASTLLRPPILNAKMSACPFLSETSWSSHFSMGWWRSDRPMNRKPFKNFRLRL